MIEDDELGIGQATALERPIDPRHKPPLCGTEPNQNLARCSLGRGDFHGMKITFYGM
jgi:hypothetical protein